VHRNRWLQEERDPPTTNKIETGRRRDPHPNKKAVVTTTKDECRWPKAVDGCCCEIEALKQNPNTKWLRKEKMAIHKSRQSEGQKTCDAKQQ
jgi:hypothetical protein